MHASGWLGLALALAGCSATNDSLVVVNVDASPALSNVSLLHTTSSAGGQTITYDLGDGVAPFSLGGGVSKTFGVDVPASVTGTFTIHVEARDASGDVLGAGDGSTNLAPAQREDISIVLQSAMVDGGAVDGGVDGMPVVDDPVFISSGGSVQSATQQINLGTGDTSFVGGVLAPSGATVQFGKFPIQAE